MDNESGKRPERRQYFRHQYPLAERPLLIIEGKTFPILDISARSLRIETTPGMTFVGGDTVSMTIRFSEGKELARSGYVVRMQDTHVGIVLSEEIPLADFLR